MASQTLEQRRALYALQVIGQHKTGNYKKRYATLVHTLPSMVLQNGLGQALAYLLADAGGKGGQGVAAGRLYGELQEWLYGNRSEERPERVYVEGAGLMTALMAGSRTEYQWAPLTARALLGWMRKFADAYLEEG